jgi:hypothetical protein
VQCRCCALAGDAVADDANGRRHVVSAAG